ncbi:manganese efflux pump MntP [Halalkalibacterium ligniniphilum]|uniref:manganese efflux pump MntP n=1 Tax=Halalkalibacterium ligniniphilum TaxID=1134413 RepID=UPI000347A048|nr:manganese efflux pump [Halalkalibacterium ligniniphilum]
MVHEFVTIFIMAGALGMDAFSIALGMGMLGLRMLQILKIGLIIGFFHVIMPLAGIAAGKILSTYVGYIATWIGGGLLCLLGVQMVLSTFRVNTEPLVRPMGIGLLMFALSVSLDSFSAGLSLGMIGAKTALTVAATGLMSMLLSWLGLLIGSRFHQYIGTFGALLGGFILFSFGVKLMLPI